MDIRWRSTLGTRIREPKIDLDAAPLWGYVTGLK